MQFLCFVGLKKCLLKGVINLIFRIVLLQHNCFSHCTMQSMHLILAVSFAETMSHLSWVHKCCYSVFISLDCKIAGSVSRLHCPTSVVSRNTSTHGLQTLRNVIWIFRRQNVVSRKWCGLCTVSSCDIGFMKNTFSGIEFKKFENVTTSKYEHMEILLDGAKHAYDSWIFVNHSK